VTPACRARLLAAPEIIILDLADSTLGAAIRALELEHPTLAEPPFRGGPPTLRRARNLVRLATRLRAELALYRDAVDAALTDPEPDEWPF
jgi:hypothetical protein